MLTPYLESVAARQLSHTVGPAAQSDIFTAFDESLSLLKDPEQFPNARINIVAIAVAALIGSEHISSEIIEDSSNKYLEFLAEVDPEAGVGYGTIVFPADFHHRTRDNPLSQLGTTASVLHHSRLFACGAHTQPDLEQYIVPQVQAMEADALHTVKTMVADEGIPYDLTGSEQRLLDSYPNGFEDIASEITFGNIPIRPMPDLSPKQIEFMGRLDYAALIAAPWSISDLEMAIFSLIRGHIFSDLPAIEQVLRSVNSPLFLQAVPPSQLNRPRAVDPISGKERSHALHITIARVGTDPQSVLTELGVSYEVNQQQLADAGVGTID